MTIPKRHRFPDIGCYNPVYVKEILKAFHLGLSLDEISLYMFMSLDEVDHIIDLYLPIAEAMGSLFYEVEDEDN